jgi:hypothetical protein
MTILYNIERLELKIGNPFMGAPHQQDISKKNNTNHFELIQFMCILTNLRMKKDFNVFLLSIYHFEVIAYKK